MPKINCVIEIHIHYHLKLIHSLKPANSIYTQPANSTHGSGTKYQILISNGVIISASKAHIPFLPFASSIIKRDARHQNKIF